MYTETTFRDEIQKIWTDIQAFKPAWYKMGSRDIEINDAWEMYEHARTSNLSELLLGDVKLRSQLEVLNNFGTTSGTETTMERNTLVGEKKQKISPANVQATLKEQLGKAYRAQDGIALIRRGSVLNDGWWWPFKNDAWVIGGIHGLKRFHMTMAAVPDDLLWDTGDKRPRVLGRELTGLATFGYKLIGVPAWAKRDPNDPVPIPKSGENAPKAPIKTIPVPAKDVREAIGNVFAPQVKTTATGATFTLYYEALKKIKGIDEIKNGILKDEVDFEKYDFSKI